MHIRILVCLRIKVVRFSLSIACSYKGGNCTFCRKDWCHKKSRAVGGALQGKFEIRMQGFVGCYVQLFGFRESIPGVVLYEVVCYANDCVRVGVVPWTTFSWLLCLQAFVYTRLYD
jgi:hypothetical protein